jgi:hypothetical protein
MKRWLQPIIMIALFTYCSWEFIQLLKQNENIMDVLVKESITMIPALLICLALLFCSMLIRANRWSKLLAQPNTLWLSFRAISIGYLVSCPLSKLGEIARLSVFKRQNNTPLPTLLSTVFIDRVMDFAALFLILVICLTTHSELIETNFPQFSQAITPITFILVSSFLLIVFMLTKMDWVENKLQQTGSLSTKYKEWILSFLKNFRDGFQYIKGLNGFLYLLVTTLAIWGIYFLILLTICTLYPNIPDTYQIKDLWIIFLIGTIGAIMPAPGGVAYPLFVKASLDLVWPSMSEVDKVALSTIIFLYNFWALNIILGGISTAIQLSQKKQLSLQVHD